MLEDEGLGLTSLLYPEGLGLPPALNGSGVHGGRVGTSPSTVPLERVPGGLTCWHV